MKLISLVLSLLFLFAPHAAQSEIIKRTYYSLSYSERHEVAEWVAYDLSKNQLKNCVGRSNTFRTDPLISTGTASTEDYSGSNFDRGHLLPAGDMKFNEQAMRDTFYMSNITPQPAKFNRGKWATLESLIRAWAFQYEKIWIVTGPILRGELATIGRTNKISIPLEYFKAVIRKTSTGYTGIGFIMPTSVPFNELENYVVSINQIEDLTGDDYFRFLADADEDKAENDVDFKKWDFRARFDYLPCDT